MGASLYLLSLLPPPEMKTEIKVFKQEMKTGFSSFHALKLQAYLTLQKPFWVILRLRSDFDCAQYDRNVWSGWTWK